jgi:phosphorylase kinase alpha/beta subunit
MVNKTLKVQQYLDEHLLKSFPLRTSLLNRPVMQSGRSIRRRMSVKGAIKKTRSIAVERTYIPKIKLLE